MGILKRDLTITEEDDFWVVIKYIKKNGEIIEERFGGWSVKESLKMFRKKHRKNW